MRRPFTTEEIETLKSAIYVPPKPLTIPGILLLILFFPFGIYYLLSKNTPEYMLNKCKTDEEREALFTYLKTPPKTHDPSPQESFLQKHCLHSTSQQLYKNPFAHNIYRVGTAEYNAAHGIHH